jgi:hypothetical protein
MNINKTLSLACLLTVGLWGLPALASDTAKEQRWAEQIVDGIFDGAPKWIEADGHKFLSI